MGIKINGKTVPLGIAGNGLPPGGTTDQVLAKKTDSNYDVEWVDQTSEIEVATTDKLGGVLSGTVIGQLQVDEDGYGSIVDNVTLVNGGELVLDGVGTSGQSHTIEFNNEDSPSSDIGYDGTNSTLSSVTVNGAIDELDTKVETSKTDISTNADNIETNTTNIADNTSKISVINNRLIYYSNENLLDNWYWTNPINQKGATSYTTAGYTIDRFGMNKGTFTVNDSYCRWVTTKDAYYKRLQQHLEFPFLGGQTYTLSLLAQVTDISGGVVLRPTFSEGPVIENFYGKSITATTSGYEVYTYTFTPKTTANNVGVEILVQNTATDYVDIKIKAWKLELGSQQTFAHKEGNVWFLNDGPPNYQQMLARCQRHMLVFKQGETKLGWAKVDMSLIAIMLVATPVPMRKLPTFTGGPVRFVQAKYDGTNATLIGFLNPVSSFLGPTYIKFTASSAEANVKLTNGTIGYLDLSHTQCKDIILDANL